MRRMYGHEKFGVHMFDPKSQDKLARLYSVQHLFAEGLVFAPIRQWAEMVIAQVGQFPKGKHDDLVDTVSMAMRHLRETGAIMRGDEFKAELSDSLAFKGNNQWQPLYPI
jgi:predicted phage terminase large subunit-like protein